jgi:hypothetical protein
MNRAIKRILYSAMVVMLLLNACAPAPAATSEPNAGEDSTVAQLKQTVEALSTAQNAPDPEKVALKQTIEALVATKTAEPAQNAQATQTPSPETEKAPLQQTLDAIGTVQVALQATQTYIPVEQTVNALAVAQSALGTQQALAFPTPSEACDITTKTPTLQIESLQPGRGETYGGTKVTIKLKNLTNQGDSSEFCFGDTKADDVKCTADTCTMKSPANKNAGEVAVIANVGGQIAVLPAGFTYLTPPSVSSVSPNQGSVSGGTRVTVLGSGFSNNTVFYFGPNVGRTESCLPDQCIVISPSIQTDEEIVVWVQASEKGATSWLDTTATTRQTFKYLGRQKFACDAFLLTPKNKTVFKSGDSFTIKWIVKNIGTRPWPAGQIVKYSGGTDMGLIRSFEIKDRLQPNNITTITVDAKAPQNKGLQYMTWSVTGQSCSLYIAIMVE